MADWLCPRPGGQELLFLTTKTCITRSAEYTADRSQRRVGFTGCASWMADEHPSHRRWYPTSSIIPATDQGASPTRFRGEHSTTWIYAETRAGSIVYRPVYHVQTSTTRILVASPQHRFLRGHGHLSTIEKSNSLFRQGMPPRCLSTRLSAALPRIRMACSAERIHPACADHNCRIRGRGGRHPAGAPHSRFSSGAARTGA